MEKKSDSSQRQSKPSGPVFPLPKGKEKPPSRRIGTHPRILLSNLLQVEGRKERAVPEPGDSLSQQQTSRADPAPPSKESARRGDLQDRVPIGTSQRFQACAGGPGHKQQPIIHGTGLIPPPGISRRDKPQVAGDLLLHLDARDRRQEAVQTCKGKKRLRNQRAGPVLNEPAYQPPKPSTYDEVLRGPSLVTEQAMAHYLLQNVRQSQPMLPPPTVRFQDLTEPDKPPLPKQWKFGDRTPQRRQRQEAIIHPSTRLGQH